VENDDSMRQGALLPGCVSESSVGVFAEEVVGACVCVCVQNVC
jgi:hypothetical protein